MSEAAEQLFKTVEEEEPTKIEVMQDGKKVAKVAVTVEETWQKRGHSSRVGVIFVISVRTGQVLDFATNVKVMKKMVKTQLGTKIGIKSM